MRVSPSYDLAYRHKGLVHMCTGTDNRAVPILPSYLAIKLCLIAKYGGKMALHLQVIANNLPQGVHIACNMDPMCVIMVITIINIHININNYVNMVSPTYSEERRICW